MDGPLLESKVTICVLLKLFKIVRFVIVIDSDAVGYGLVQE